ncbi:nucleotide exchange factor GrpE [Nemorincola caseinilytica]|uniref:Protein GrpE n=1 Tax=Nemorincola caseinilytica TaxID=2054315 RepID=A0ABP8NIU1_9BACT
MSEQKADNSANMNENTDNLSQNENMDEALASMLNTDDSRSTAELPDDGDDEEKEKMAAEIAELKDKVLRQVAEFENYKRRSSREMMELRQTAGREVIQSMLEVLDDMDRAEKQIEGTTDIAVVKEGIALVFSKMRNVMQQKGLKKMDAVNTEFNADLHEAITEIDAPENMKGKVIDMVESGYYLNDKLIRYAKVVVGK